MQFIVTITEPDTDRTWTTATRCERNSTWAIARAVRQHFGDGAVFWDLFHPDAPPGVRFGRVIRPSLDRTRNVVDTYDLTGPVRVEVEERFR